MNLVRHPLGKPGFKINRIRYFGVVGSNHVGRAHQHSSIHVPQNRELGRLKESIFYRTTHLSC
jgi:hypothetical protein